MPSQSHASFVYAVKTDVYSLTLLSLDFSNEIINYSIVPPPGGGGKGGTEAPGPLLGKLNSLKILKVENIDNFSRKIF